MSAENALPQEETPNSVAGGAPTADYSIGDGATAKLLPGIQSSATSSWRSSLRRFASSS